MNEKERLQLENELLMTCSKAQAINKYIDELEESSKLSELWCKSQQENKELKEGNTIYNQFVNYKNWYFDYVNKYEKLEKENKELHNKIDKLLNENQSLRTRIKTIKRLRKHQTQKKNKYKSIVTDLQKALTEKNNKIDKAIELLSHFSGCQICEHTQELAVKVEEILKDSDVDE